MKKLSKDQKKNLNGGSCYKGAFVKGAIDQVTVNGSALGSIVSAKMCK
jgi:hypothetical protein